MANVLYIDANALKSLAVAGLLNSLLDTGRKVIITSSVIDELGNTPSSQAASLWIDRNILLGNVTERTTTQTGRGG